MIDIEDITEELIIDLEKAARAVMISKGLSKQDNLVRTIEFKESNDGLIMVANEYYNWVDLGRKKRITKVPIQALIQWIKDKRIATRGRQTISQLAFAIQKGIYRNGIKPLKYGDPVEEVVADISEEGLIDGIEEAVLEEIDKLGN